MAKTVRLTVNGKRHTVQSAPDTPLLYVLTTPSRSGSATSATSGSAM